MAMIYSVAGAEGTAAATMDRARRLMGAHRAAVTGQAPVVPLPGPAAVAGPEGVVRHPVRAAHRHPMGVPAPGTRVRVRDDVLAAPGSLAGRRSLATPARTAAGRTPRCRPTRLVQGGGRQLPPAGDERRPKTGPSPVDRAKTGSKHH